MCAVIDVLFVVTRSGFSSTAVSCATFLKLVGSSPALVVLPVTHWILLVVFVPFLLYLAAFLALYVLF